RNRERAENSINQRAISQQKRRAREKEVVTINQISSSQQVKSEYERTENIVNKRSISQQERRRCDREANEQTQSENEQTKRACTISHNELLLQFQYNNVRHNLGHMNAVCVHCGALHWLEEHLGQDAQCKEFRANIHQYNAAYAFISLGAHEILSQTRIEDLSENDLAVYLYFDNITDRRRYNLLTSNKIAVILPGDGSTPEAIHDIVLRLHRDPLQRIHEGHPAYLPLHYILFFPYGDLGWHAKMRQTLLDDNGHPAENQSKAPCFIQMDYYSFHLFSRYNEFSTILHGRKLLQEFMVDAWAATEQNHLRFLWLNQDSL
ncbi:8936_t:CDS:2, partial [Ambispora leptoticha]